MPDAMDQAQEAAEAWQADRLADHRLRLRDAAASTRAARTHCEDCGGEIPEKRRRAQAGCRRCVSCQEILENWRPL
ncbi:MAG: TraR/DksA C4-type zinc finger protein [Desulfuromonadales bacterium]|nr:TraR/DksA C4-type zinc finger protein [Desulfuromonadales bacterium]